MEKAFSTLLSEYREKHELTQPQMAERLGISLRMYNYYEKGDYDGQPKKIKKYIDKLASNLQHKNGKEPLAQGTPIYDVPVTASHNENVSQVAEQPAYYISLRGYEDCNFGMFVYGHSMYPVIETGSLVLCRKVNNKNVIMYGEVYLIRTPDYFMVKRLQKADTTGHVLCTSDNFETRAKDFKRFEPFELPIDEILDLYLVKGVIKKTQT